MISIRAHKISCIWVYPAPIPQEAVDVFFAQTYRHKELVIAAYERDHRLVEGATTVAFPNDLDLNWLYDLAIELTTGELICWHVPSCLEVVGNDPWYLANRYKAWLAGSSGMEFFSKEEFYRAQNMLYCGSKHKNKEYFNEV